jgi:pyridoxal phosphate enzyme (YggS family)
VIDSAALQARLDGVRDRIARAASRAGRDAASVRLIAVSKTFSADHIRAAAASHQVDFGENKVQEAERKAVVTAGLPLRWHLIGHLQSNKARKAAARFDVIHSVDSGPLVTALDEAAANAGRTLELLIQVDLAGEVTKHGVRAEALLPIFEAAGGCRAVRVVGLMLLPPAVADPEDARPHFAALRRLRDDLIRQGVDRTELRELSMGMSGDFDIAIEEGATMVRVGTAIFGERTIPTRPSL